MKLFSDNDPDKIKRPTAPGATTLETAAAANISRTRSLIDVQEALKWIFGALKSKNKTE